MRRFKLVFAVIAVLYLLLPICAYGQEPVIVEKSRATGKPGLVTINYNAYANALARQDYNTALKHWKIVREAARILVQEGNSDYQKYDKDMPWPWGDPPTTGGSGGGSQPGTDSSDEQAQPISVDIFDWVEVENDCCEPVERPVHESQTGYEEGLTTVDVTVHGRVVDHTGMPVRDATVGLTNDGKTTTTDSRGRFSLMYYAEGFGPVDIPIEIELVCSCISIEPVEVGLGVIQPIGKTSNTFQIYNSCETAVEVSMPMEPEIPAVFGNGLEPGDGLSLTIADCSGGHSTLGSAVEGGGGNATLGPGARCKIKVSWAPSKEMMLDRRVDIPNSASPSPKCHPKVRIVGASTWGIEVTPKELRYPGVVGVGESQEINLSISNRSQSDLTVRRISFTGPHAADFSATYLTSHKGQPGRGRDFLLKPDGVYTVTVRYSPKDDGVRLGTLVVHSTDPAAPRILVPLSGLAEYTVGPPGTTSTIRDAQGSTAQPQPQNDSPATPPRAEPPPKRPEPTAPGRQESPPPKDPSRPTQGNNQTGPAQGLTPADVIITADGETIFLYSLNPSRQHGMVLLEGDDIEIEGGTIVFTDDSARAAFFGDARDSTVFVVDTGSRLKTGIHKIGTKTTLRARLENGAMAFWEQTRELSGDEENAPINVDIRTPNAHVAPEGTSFLLTYDEKSAVTELTVFDGRVAFQPDGIDLPPVWVEPGYLARATGKGFPQIEVGSLDPDQWNQLYDAVMATFQEVDRQR